jgi:hypothetical protein
MKKVILSAAVLASLAFSNNAKAQLVDEQNVTVTMDLQPILQLGMNGSSNVDFVFDQIPEYIAGITQYGATQLMVTSTVNWDLYAVGFSSNAGTGIWDQQLQYGAGTDLNAQDDLPLTALELHQDKQGAVVGALPANATGDDYFAAFTSAVSIGDNNVYCSQTPYIAPAATAKYIAGHATNLVFMTGGTYLVSNASGVGAAGDFYYSMDYRIIPGLPAVFPNASLFTGAEAPGGNVVTAQTQINAATGQYAQSGVYTMNVKYVLMEN